MDAEDVAGNAIARDRMNEPYYVESRKGWYLRTRSARGKRSTIRLGATKEEAFAEWHRRIGGEPGATTHQLDNLLDSYLSWARRQVEIGSLEELTLGGYGRYLGKIADRWPDLSVDDLRPFHITTIIQESNWGPAGERNCISAIKRALNWAVEQGIIEHHKLAKMKRPATPRRKVTIADDAHEKMMGAAGGSKFSGRKDRSFRLVLVALKHCGGRPQDVANARIENIDANVTAWTIADHKTARKTGRDRVVYLSGCLQTVTRIAMHGRKKGPLFQNRAGAVTVNAITNRFKRLRQKLGLPEKTVAYSYRHTYITDALTRGVDPATVAELTGTSIEMIQRHYGHLYGNKQHLRDAANLAVRRSGG